MSGFCGSHVPLHTNMKMWHIGKYLYSAETEDEAFLQYNCDFPGEACPEIDIFEGKNIAIRPHDIEDVRFTFNVKALTERFQGLIAEFICFELFNGQEQRLWKLLKET